MLRYHTWCSARWTWTDTVDLVHLLPSLTTSTLCATSILVRRIATWKPSYHCQTCSEIALRWLANFLPTSQYVVIWPLPCHTSTIHTCSVMTKLNNTFVNYYHFYSRVFLFMDRMCAEQWRYCFYSDVEFSFLPARRERCAVTSHDRVSVCVTRRYCIKTAKRRITQTTSRDSPRTLVFWRQNSLVDDPTSPWNLRSKWYTSLSNSTISTNICS